MFFPGIPLDKTVPITVPFSVEGIVAIVVNTTVTQSSCQGRSLLSSKVIEPEVIMGKPSDLQYRSLMVHLHAALRPPCVHR
jgi:hypothetical protein